VEIHSGNTYRVSNSPRQGRIPAGSVAVRAVRGRAELTRLAPG